MTIIYKTTELQGRRAILSLPLSKDEALAVIKKVAAAVMGGCTETEQGISIKFHGGDISAVYSVEEEKTLSLPDNQDHV